MAQTTLPWLGTPMSPPFLHYWVVISWVCPPPGFVKVLKASEKERHTISLCQRTLPAPHHAPFVFPFLTFNKPYFTHVFCLDSSAPKRKDQSLLKTLFAFNTVASSHNGFKFRHTFEIMF
jgi:hypothetical protein